jgi:hypothetical protein
MSSCSADPSKSSNPNSSFNPRIAWGILLCALAKFIRISPITAGDVRDSLPAVCVGPSKNLKRFVDGKIDFDDAYHNAMDAGGGNAKYKRLHGFRQWLAKVDTERDLVDTKEKNIRDKIGFELEKIEKRSKQLHTAMSKKS